MPSEPGVAERGLRLHPASLLFSIGAAIRNLLLPGLAVLVFRRGADYDVWLMVMFLPAAAYGVLKYASLRYRLGPAELVINEGLINRQERHIPYSRIQNIDLVQTVVHRVLRVATVTVETAGGAEPEATLNVLSLRAVEEMRRRVFSGRASAAASRAAGEAASESALRPAENTLVEVPLRELVLLGIISNRGMLVVLGAWAALWQFGLIPDRWWSSTAAYLTRRVPAVVPTHGVGAVVLALAGLVAFVVLIRLLSIAWAVFSLYGFTLTQSDEELRTRFGLLTRHAATIPRHRIQLLHVVETPLHRLFGRVTVKVETAGSGAPDQASIGREWLVPLLPRERLPALLEQVQPEACVPRAAWQAVDARAARRIGRRMTAVSVAAAALAAGLWWPWGMGLLVVLVPLSWLHGVKYARSLSYALTSGGVLFRSGWVTRRTSAVRYGKVQVLGMTESPFDRRYGMAGVSVDTAGAGRVGHSVRMPYLDRALAEQIVRTLRQEAVASGFQW